MTYRIARMGWLPDPLDHRDLDLRDHSPRERVNRVVHLTSRAVTRASHSPAGPVHVDLRPWCSPIENQGSVGSCTAQAVVGALEYFERKTRGHHVDASRMFLYRATRRYLGWEGRGDTGAFVRSAIKALRLFGSLPETYWPYDEARFDDEPEAFHYAFAQNFKAIEYYRVPETVADLQGVLAAGLPVVFGFTCFTSLFTAEVNATGVIPYPSAHDQVEGGHAVLAVGFTESHLIFRNSWGADWGDQGHGYLPWSYFDSTRPLATDCWVLVNATWVAEDEGEVTTSAVAPQTKHLPARAGRAQTGLQQTEPVHRRPPDRYRARVAVTRGNDPTRSLPLTFATGALRADADAPSQLVASAAPVSLYLRSVKLLDSFDWSLFGKATNELYLSAVVWDLSGKPPRVFPPEQISDQDARVYRLTDGQTVNFVGDGLQLWPAERITGGLYVRLVVMESDNDVREVGRRLGAVHEAVKKSPLPRALEALALAGGATAPALAAVGAAAELLTSVVASELKENGDDLVALFDGTYGAENVTKARIDEYEQGGASIVLAFGVGAA